MRYSQVEDKQALLDIIRDEEKQQGFMYGFLSAITFAHYKDLNNEQKELYCSEMEENILNSIGLGFMNEFLQEYNLPPMIRE